MGGEVGEVTTHCGDLTFLWSEMVSGEQSAKI